MTETTPSYNAAYVDLLKKILRNSIYSEPVSVTPEDIRACTQAVAAVRAEKPWVFERYSSLSGERLAGILAYTKCSRSLHTYVREAGLDNIERCVREIVEQRVPGDLLDAGTLRGGTAILMRGLLNAYGARSRKVIVADSFEGLPAPSAVDSVFDREIWFALADVLPQYNLRCVETLARVRDNFEAYGLLDDQVEFLAGWFKDTLGSVAPRRLALVRIDADWYEGTRDALDMLYPLVSPGGYVIVDDYKLEGCKRAVDDYRIKHRVFDKVQVADEEDGVVFWKKGRA